MHLEDAYVVDQQKYGNFTDIGYEAPTSTVFTYTDGKAVGTDSWKATSTVLNKCASQTWKVGVTITSGKASYNAVGCDVLTPNFKNIGKSGTGS